MLGPSSQRHRVGARGPHTGQRGYSLTEVLVILTIIGVVAALGVPRLTRERVAADGRAFGELIAREMQRARMAAISSRLPQYVFVYADRIEVRSARAGLTPVAPLIAPSTTDAVSSTVRGKGGIIIRDVVTATTANPGAVVTSTSNKQVVFSTMGAGFIAPTAPAVPGPVYVYLENTDAPSGHPDRKFRVDVAPLTGSVQLRYGW
jgi:prepilin-type N-terminal cleavage/methylation domain-containing protein